MAVPPAVVIQSGLGASSQPANQALQNQAVKLTHVDGAITANPVALTRVIQEIASNLQSTSQVALANPIASSVTQKDLVSNGDIQIFNHNLGRAYQGFDIVRVRAVLNIFCEVWPTPDNVDVTKQIAIQSLEPGSIFDLRVY